MVTYVVRRLLLLPLLLLAAATLIFLLTQFLTPEQRATLYIVRPSQINQIGRIIKEHGLDAPMWEQAWAWFQHVLRGNLGFSFVSGQPVVDTIMTYAPATFELALASVFPLLFGGMWMGVLASKYHNRLVDHTIRLSSIVGLSVPGFILGLVSLMIFFGYLGWISAGRLSVDGVISMLNSDFTFYTGFYTVDSLLNGRLDLFFDAALHLLLPALSVAVASWALFVRVLRSSMLNILREDYITTARAVGVNESTIFKKHAKRNAIIPVITVSGPLVAGLLSGIVITEVIFNIKGIGLWFTMAAIRLDIPSVIGFAMFSGMLVVLANLIIDVSYAYLDPRIRLR